MKLRIHKEKRVNTPRDAKRGKWPITVAHDEVDLATAGCAPTPLALARIPRDASFPRVLCPGREVWS